MIKKIFGMCMVLFLLSACSFLQPATPSTSQLETSVFQTLTAMPTLVPGQAVATSAKPTKVPATQPPVQGTITVTLVPPTITSLPPVQPTYPPVVQPTAVTYYSPAYADQFIYYYFININQRNYPLTWGVLTDSFKYANNSADEGGYLGYVDFWNSVQRVDILGVTITSLSGNYAAVSVSMRYNYKSGSVVSNLQAFNLLYDASRATWMFNSLTPISTPTPLPPIVQSPDQFIYSYFATVNSGNYALGWTFLTDRFKINVNKNSYTDYTDFWSSVSHADVSSVSINSQNGGNAVVSVTLVFHYNGGTVTALNAVYYLVYDWGRATWLFDSPN